LIPLDTWRLFVLACVALAVRLLLDERR